MEYLSTARGNASHVEAEKLMNGMGYLAHCISDTGFLITTSSVSEHMVAKKMDSDNIVFVKK